MVPNVKPDSSAGTLASQDPRSARLDRLIREELVSPVFQPIVCLQTGEVAAFEALARPAKDTGYAHAGELFEEAEELGRLWDLESLTRRKSIAAASDFPDGVLLFLNSTPCVFADPRFQAELEQAVRTSGNLVPGRMVLEITEASDDQVFEGLLDQVRALTGMGYHVAIDDAGAGTSGLKRMLLLRPSWLKLDRALIESVDQDPFQHNFIRFLIHFARMSGVNVVAEGIERHDQLGTLIDLGVRFGQGFLLAKPAPGYQMVPEDLRRWVKTRWSQRLTTPGSDPGGTPIGTLGRPAPSLQANTPIEEAAAQLGRSAEIPGFAIQDGRRFVGWCSRNTVLAAHGREPAATPIGFITSAGPAPISPDASLSEALELVSSREEHELAHPLVVADADRIFGIVPLRTLLWAAGGQSSPRRHRRNALTGLPDQVAADHRVASLIQHAQDGESLAIDQDAALIDLRGFEEFNARLGYDLGDQLLIDLASLLQNVMSDAGQTGFVAHLSIDRFLVIGPSRSLGERLERCLARFDASLASSGLATGGAANDAERIRLRILWMPKIFARIRQPRDLVGMERRLRGKSRLLEQAQSTPGSVLVRDDAWDPATPLRLTA